jgi:hypothetical protein
MKHFSTVLFTLCAAFASSLQAADSAIIDTDHAVAVIAKKLAAYDASQPDKTAYPTEVKGA